MQPTRDRRLQVFVSSTYLDLKVERQAAVQAILAAGHIPAGMELFAAGDAEQMAVIHRWIDESDVVLLILGGRYGSINQATGKSYTHMEFDYAIERGKPLFAVVLSNAFLEKKAKADGLSVLEQGDTRALSDFRREVEGRLVKYCDDTKDIKLAIYGTMADFSRRPELTGWVRADSLTDLRAANTEVTALRQRIQELELELSEQEQLPQSRPTTLPNNEAIEMLKGWPLTPDIQSRLRPDELQRLQHSTAVLGEPLSSFHALWTERVRLGRWSTFSSGMDEVFHYLTYLGFLESGTTYGEGYEGPKFTLAQKGRNLLYQFEIELARERLHAHDPL